MIRLTRTQYSLSRAIQSARMNMNSPLYRYRLEIVVGALVLSVALVLIFPVVSVFYGFISNTIARLLIAGFGAFGTILLAILTFLTIQNNRVLVEERRKDREQPIQRAVLSEVVVSSIEAVEANNTAILDGRVNWSDAKIDLQKGGLVNRSGCLKMCLPSADSAILEYAEEEYPELIRILREYDSEIHEAHNVADELLRRLEEPVTEIRQNTANITESDHDVLMSLVMHAYDTLEGRPDWWQENHEDIKDEIKSEVPEIEEWYERQKELHELSLNTKSQLVEYKQEIQTEYGINLNDNINSG